MRNPNGPVAKVIECAQSRPGHVISWSEARVAYGTGIVKGYNGPRRAAAHHNMSISNVLHRYFTRVDGTRGLYVLTSSICNHDRDDDELEMKAFHAANGCDEFGMSTNGYGYPLVRMSDIINEGG